MLCKNFYRLTKVHSVPWLPCVASNLGCIAVPRAVPLRSLRPGLPAPVPLRERRQLRPRGRRLLLPPGSVDCRYTAEKNIFIHEKYLQVGEARCVTSARAPGRSCTGQTAASSAGVTRTTRRCKQIYPYCLTFFYITRPRARYVQCHIANVLLYVMCHLNQEGTPNKAQCSCCCNEAAVAAMAANLTTATALHCYCLLLSR